METDTFNQYFFYIFLFVFTMIFAFSAKQLQEMAREFEEAQASGTFEAPWWMSNEAAFPNSETEKEDSNEKNSSEKDAEDAKPSAKPSPEEAAKSRGCPRRRGNCRAYGRRGNCRAYGRCDPSAMFQHCLRMQQEAARRQGETKKTTIVEQKSPIHMHEETDDAARMSLDLTGFSASNISIHVENYIVSIVANRTNKLGDVFVVDRRFRLDKKTANPDQITSIFEDGILELTVPKKSAIGPRKIPIAVARPVATNEESIEKDDETSKTSNYSASAPSSAADEDVKFAESTVEDTSPPKKEEEPEEQQVQEEAQEEISVETVDEQNETTEDDNNTNSTETVATKSESEDETWEEVSGN